MKEEIKVFFKKDMDSYEYTEEYEKASKVGWGHPHRSSSERKRDIEEYENSLDARFNPSERTEILRKVARGERT